MHYELLGIEPPSTILVHVWKLGDMSLLRTVECSVAKLREKKVTKVNQKMAT